MTMRAHNAQQLDEIILGNKIGDMLAITFLLHWHSVVRSVYDLSVEER